MATFADDLKRIAMSAELARTLSRAAEYAGAQSHDQIQLEHLLLALSEDQDAAVVLSASHVDVNLLKADVSQYLGGLTERIVDGAAWPTVSADLKRILEAAAAAATHGRRRDINGAIVLAAIVGDGRSPAAHMLRAQGLTFDEAIRALQRAIAQPAQPAQITVPAAPPAAGTEDILAAARERIRRSRGVEAHPVAQYAPASAPAPRQPEPEPEPEPAPASAGPWREDMPRHMTEAPARQPEAEYYPEHTQPEPAAEAVPPSPGYEDALYEPASDTHSGMGGNTEGSYGGPVQDAAEPPRDDQSYAREPQVHQAPYGEQAWTPHAPLPPQGMRPRAPLPEAGSRWPAPVAPAWRDAEPVVQPAAPGPPMPPPLPYSGPSAPPQAPEPYALGYPGQDGPAAWDAPPGYSADYGPAGVQPPPPSDEPYAGGPYPPQQSERPPGQETAGAMSGYAGLDAGGKPIGPVVLTDGPATRPRRGRRQTEAAARALGEGLPRLLRMGVPVTVEARLAKSEIFALASSLSATPGRAPQPGLAMSVRLRAPDGGVVIDASSSETHWFETRPEVIQSETAHWQWTVTAVEPGRPRLQLIAAVRATGADGVTGDYMLPDTLVEVRVRRSFGRVVMRLFRLALVAGIGAGTGFYGPAVWPSIWAAVQRLLK